MELRNQFQIDPAAEPYNVPIRTYLDGQSPIQGICTGAVVFCGGHVLLVRRAADDFMGLKWEIPGGACEENKDESILHAVAREVLEETGLRVSRFRRMVRINDFLDTAGKLVDFRWRKLTFEVEVAVAELNTPLQQVNNVLQAVGRQIKLDPAEHDDWGWATRAQLETSEWEKGPIDFVIEQRETLLHAFGMSV